MIDPKSGDYKLDSINIELQGVTLVEAAAGTGKTYNIQNLAARMIVEKGFPINSIVIVTFTELAARELTDRLRIVLENLSGYLHDQPVDPREQKRIGELVDRFDRVGISRDQQRLRVDEALRDFDDNRVSTIHGFCGRVLSENAFESSVAFRVRLEKNIDVYTDKLLGDYCRIRRYGNSLLPGSADLTVEQLQDTVRTVMRRPQLEQVMVRQVWHDEQALLQKLDELIDKLHGLPDPLTVLREIPGTFRKVGGMVFSDYMTVQIQRLDLLLQTPESLRSAYQEYRDVLKGITHSFLLENIDRRQKSTWEIVAGYLESNELFALAEEYCNTVDIDCMLFLRREACAFVSEQLTMWKKRDNFQGFDDLINQVNNALQTTKLAAALQQKFKAAIIDEFQDTDAVQYNIFKQLFIERSEPIFFMVGDPRQAIYSFRGGDLATYMQARRECGENKVKHLVHNFRSSREMIKAFNRIFEHNNLFASSEITLGETYVSDNPIPGLKRKDGADFSPLQVDYQPGIKTELLYQNCAEKIVRMLNSGEYQLYDKVLQEYRRITPGDIAVLAFKNSDLERVRVYLKRFNVPVVSERKCGIWSSPEAGELAVFLNAVLNNTQEGLVREALLTKLGGLTLADLDKMQADSGLRQLQWQLSFMDLEQTWRSSGIAVMLQLLFRMDFGNGNDPLKVRLARLQSGERMIANYLQLSDLLAAAELNKRLSPRGVLNFLQTQISSGQSDDESAEMLESDRRAVKLMTIHASKGLQFPLVFLPNLASSHRDKSTRLKIYHRDGKLCCNPDKLDPEGHLLGDMEELQELMRLIYVAITRACCGCFINWGKSKSSSQLDWLFRMRNYQFEDLTGTVGAFLNILPGKFKLPEPDIPLDLRAAEPGTAELELPLFYQENLPEVELHPPDADSCREVSDNWRLMSYSSLAAEHTSVVTADFYDYDQQDENNLLVSADPSELLSGGIWDIPGGAAIGNAWHKILENMDFTAPADPGDVQRVMQLFGMDKLEYTAESCRMLDNLLSYTLPCGLQLKNLPPERKFTEFEFLLHSRAGIQVSEIMCSVQNYLQKEFGRSYTNADAGFSQRVNQGFFTGFIDMIFEYEGKFYIVDWKSNTLNRQADDFSGDRLKQHMFDATYPLQYLCYIAALMSCLAQRLQMEFDEAMYEKYFGEVYYIFLRGMTLPEPGGVFAARPPFQVIYDLRSNIINSQSGERNA